MFQQLSSYTTARLLGNHRLTLNWKPSCFFQKVTQPKIVQAQYHVSVIVTLLNSQIFLLSLADRMKSTPSDLAFALTFAERYIAGDQVLFELKHIIFSFIILKREASHAF